MCRRATVRAVSVACLAAALPWCVWGQGTWRRVGNSAMDLALPSLATGAVDRVWYAADGSTLYARTASGRMFQTSDLEQWRLVTDPKAAPPAPEDVAVARAPEPGFKVANRARASGRLYGLARDVYRSEDGGVSWVNLTAYKGACLLGDG